MPYGIYAHRDSDLETLGWVSFWDDTANREPMRWLEDRGEPDGLQMTSTDATAVYSAVKTGIGKALIPTEIGDRDPELVCLSESGPEIVRTLKAIIHPDLVNTPRIMAVIEWLQEVFAGKKS